MRIVLALALTLGMFSSGCALFGGSDDEAPQAAQQPTEQMSAEAPAPAMEAEHATKTDKKKEKAHSRKTEKASSKGKKSEAEIAAELDRVGHKLVAQASRTIMPSKTSKKVTHRGKDYVATYVEVDTTHVHTSMRPSSVKGNYVGIITYTEKIMECHGPSQKAALAETHCHHASTRHMKELISYDGKNWQY
ncbi:MAG: translation initiation factor 2 [Desulfovibrio sp.]|nr:translation initiation factor 2 [Desulfovibrio sp.]